MTAARRWDASKSAMSDSFLAEVAARFRALGEPARLRILRRLLLGEASIGELAAAAESSIANTSKHVAILVDAGFLARRKDGTTVIVSIDDPGVPELCDLMCGRVRAQAESRLAGIRPASGRRRRTPGNPPDPRIGSKRAGERRRQGPGRSGSERRTGDAR